MTVTEVILTIALAAMVAFLAVMAGLFRRESTFYRDLLLKSQGIELKAQADPAPKDRIPEPIVDLIAPFEQHRQRIITQVWQLRRDGWSWERIESELRAQLVSQGLSSGREQSTG